MTTVRELHNRAMVLAQEALVLRSTDDNETAIALAREAFKLEALAVRQIPQSEDVEPTRSILCQSAASLALQCSEFAEARRYAALGLSGDPPRSIAGELLQLLETISFHEALTQDGIQLGDEFLECALTGPAVGYGVVGYREFIDRITQITQLLDRTVQRLVGSAYRRAGRRPKDAQPFVPFLEAPQRGSFSVTIRLGTREGEMAPLFPSAHDVITNVLEGIELVDSERESELQTRIKDDAYYVNFVSLTRNMAPDGEKISVVQLRSRDKKVSLARSRTSIPVIQRATPVEPDVPKHIDIKGLLDFATSRKGESEIGLTTDDGSEYDIEVQEGLDDLVRSYYGAYVNVTGLLTIEGNRKRVLLTDVCSGG